MLHKGKFLGQSEACRKQSVFNRAALHCVLPFYALEWLRMGPSCDLYAAGVPGTLKKLGVNGPTPAARIVAPEME